MATENPSQDTASAIHPTTAEGSRDNASPPHNLPLHPRHMAKLEEAAEEIRHYARLGNTNCQSLLIWMPASDSGPSSEPAPVSEARMAATPADAPLRGVPQSAAQSTASQQAPCPAGETTPGELTVSERYILQAMLRLGAVGKEAKKGQKAILVRAGLDNPEPKNHSHSFNRLRELGLVGVEKAGRRGGTWLTEAGERLARKLAGRS